VPDVHSYDVVWFFKLDAVLALAPLFEARTAGVVVDLDDLISLDHDLTPEKLRPASGQRSSWRSRRMRIDSRIDSLDRERWAAWRDRIVRRASLVVLANPSETNSIDGAHTVVVPNGYDVPEAHGVRPVQPHVRLLFVGAMHYFPNTDGALFLVHDIVPRLRLHLGSSFEVRIVGHAGDAVQQLAEDPNVVVTGFVENLDEELARADAVVVPLRHGTGTRLKILEAFAHEIPVVSTAIGASGLGCENERHLLLADSSDAFTDACLRVVRDAELRARLTRNAYALVANDYDWPVIGKIVTGLVESLTDDTTEPHD
jgi:glycosyltransferase involved in cell wall biosynthesis